MYRKVIENSVGTVPVPVPKYVCTESIVPVGRYLPVCTGTSEKKKEEIVTITKYCEKAANFTCWIWIRQVPVGKKVRYCIYLSTVGTYRIF